MKTALAVFAVLSSLAHAQDPNPVQKESGYCEVVIAMEKKNFEALPNPRKELEDDVTAFIKSITPDERAIMKVEGSASPRLKDFDRRGKELVQKYEAQRYCPVDMYVDEDNSLYCMDLFKQRRVRAKEVSVAKFGLFQEPEAGIKNREMIIGYILPPGDMKGVGATIVFSTPEKELAQLKSKLPPDDTKERLKEHIQKTVPEQCLTDKAAASIFDDGRSSGKDVEEKAKSKSKQLKSSGVLKQ